MKLRGVALCYVNVILFCLLLVKVPFFRELGVILFAVMSIVILSFLLACVFSFGTMCNCLFCLLTGLGIGPVYLAPLALSWEKYPRLNVCLSLECLFQYPASHRVVKAYLDPASNRRKIALYRVSILIVLAAKLLLCGAFLAVGFISHDLMFALFGLTLAALMLELATTEKDTWGRVGEWILYQRLGHLDCDETKAYFYKQIPLYFPQDRELFIRFTTCLWPEVKRTVTSPHSLSFCLYCVYLCAIADPAYSFDEQFNSDVFDLVLKWVEEQQIASLPWWFINLYILWAHTSNQHELALSVAQSMGETFQAAEDIPIKAIHNLRKEQFDSAIAWAEQGRVNQKNKRKILYQHSYCKLVPAYHRAYQTACLMLTKR